MISRYTIGLAIRPIFGPDLDSYKNPPPLKSGLILGLRIVDSRNILKSLYMNQKILAPKVAIFQPLLNLT